MTLDDLRRQVGSGQVDTVLVVFPDLYGRLIGKRVTGRFFVDETAHVGMHTCDYLLTVDMEMEVIEGYAFANWQAGYGDVHCLPDWTTLRQVDWLDRTALIFCDLHQGAEVPVAIAPRTMLHRQIERCAAVGLHARCATELEYYLFRDSYDEARRKKYDGDDLEPWGAYIEDYHILAGTKAEAYHGAVRRHMDASGVPVESSKGEWGPGQHEINFRYDDALKTADRTALLKHGCKEIAHQQDCSVSFMAKWRTDLAGSSGHLHLSMWDAAGQKNLFTTDSGGESDTFRHFLGGWMAHARAISPFYAPYPNSYKRYVHQSWAPTAIAWSRDNRTAGFRVVGAGPSLRIESRLPGADANPYLAIAATLAAGLDGVQQRTEPPAEFIGDVYDGADLPRIPANLTEATAELSSSSMMRDAFGDEVLAHYLHFFHTEQRKFDTVVTNWERARYFERG